MTEKTKFGFCVPAWTYASPWDRRIDYSLIKNAVTTSECLGYDSIWVPDHVMLGHYNENYEAWTLLTALSQITESVRLGTLVTNPQHRSPAMLAKTVATLDNLSEGRVELGIGAGWMRTEQVAYGLPWNNSPKVRIGQLIDTLEIVIGMWTNDSFTYKGDYYSVDGAICAPGPIQKPRPNIWIGGGGEKKTLRVAAKYGDGWNAGELAPEDYAHKLDVLKGHCQKLGKDYDHIQKSLETYVIITNRHEELEKAKDWGNFSMAELFQQLKLEFKPPVSSLDDWKKQYIMGTRSEVTDRIAEYIKVGVNHFMMYFIDYPTLDSMKAFARDVIPSVS